MVSNTFVFTPNLRENGIQFWRFAYFSNGLVGSTTQLENVLVQAFCNSWGSREPFFGGWPWADGSHPPAFSSDGGRVFVSSRDEGLGEVEASRAAEKGGQPGDTRDGYPHNKQPTTDQLTNQQQLTNNWLTNQPANQQTNNWRSN